MNLAATGLLPLETLGATSWTIMVVIAVVALVALGIAGILARKVLAADEGTMAMRDIAQAVQEGASAYLGRQFRT
ncbi:MAG TPA: hypothetical protein DCM67_02810, partial [Propionibacteriaceae bacterium]|nr:hypothetical protein [Propionibacteriaceae bacterium]